MADETPAPGTSLSSENGAAHARNPTSREIDDASRLVDWNLASATVAKLVSGGPGVPIGEARSAVEELRTAAARSTEYVGDITGLHATPGEGVVVVDRAGWAKANVDSFRNLLAPPMSAALRRRKKSGVVALLNAPGVMLGRKGNGAEMGAVLGFLSTKVLGQYDIGGGALGLDGPGQLLLVAPNVVAAERELGVNPSDFRLWVCLHEETHRVQFSGVPWLREHMVTRVRGLVGGLLLDPEETIKRLVIGLKEARGADGQGSGTMLDLIQTPEQRAETAALTAVMSLLEGHADVVMDRAGPLVIPTVFEIRDKFDQRRQGRPGMDRMLRRLLGLDAKMRQYSDGAHFVRGAIDAVGMKGFNAVWTSPETLPTPAEIQNPAAWVARVHG